MKLGILSALDDELAHVLESLRDRRVTESAGRSFHAGRLHDVDVIAVAARMGKVAAAMAATTLILRHGVTHLLVVGAAGSAAPRALRGDVVIARGLIQHDLDASPLCPPLEAPLTGRAVFETDTDLTAGLADSARRYLADGLQREFDHDTRRRFGLHGPGRPQLLHADIMTGDRFIADAAELRATAERAARHARAAGRELDLVAVEMEGAAAAQVCAEHAVPFAVLRIISDSADEDAADDFGEFLRRVAGRYAAGIIREFCASR